MDENEKDAEIEALLHAWLDPNHICSTMREESTYPDYHGRIVVTGYCECGAVTSHYNDGIM